MIESKHERFWSQEQAHKETTEERLLFLSRGAQIYHALYEGDGSVYS